MFSVKTKIVAATILALINAPAAFGQQPQASTPKPEVEYVTEKGFKSKVFELRHREPDSLYTALRPLGSGFKGATMSISRDLRTITVRDFPENIAVIEEAIKRLDTPEAPRPGIEFRVHVFVATNTGTSSSQIPPDLNDVIKQLQSTLSYKNYTLMTSQVVRAKEGPGGVSNKGVAELKLSTDIAGSQNPIFYDYGLERISLDAAASGPSKVQIEEFRFNMKIPLEISPRNVVYENIGFRTPVSLREGEKVVVGTTSMQDKGIVIVLAATVTK